MASRISMDPPSRPDQPRPEPGQILIVIHDFSARSSDELTLSKGDRVELIERDDDFGDGWYLGRHLLTGASGLFPEVYTRIAPRGPPSYPPTNTSNPRSYPTALSPTKEPAIESPVNTVNFDVPEVNDAGPETPNPEAERSPQTSRHVSTSEPLDSSYIASALSRSSISQDPEKLDTPTLPPTISTNLPIQPKSVIVAAKTHAHGQDSPVMNETLSVIDEHITDMSSPQHNSINSMTTDRRGTNDSGSEYSSHIDQRMSYINGEETDEEEEGLHSREEVSIWSPDEVAEYLFTAGVETKHCEVFRDQEITGDVLLGMDQTSLFIQAFDLGSVGRRLKTWQKIKTLQDEVNGTSTRRNTITYGSEAGSEDARHRSRSVTSPSMLPRIPSLMERPGSRQTGRISQPNSQQDQVQIPSPVSPMTAQGSPRPTNEKRPSAASIRDMHHSRQNSMSEFSTTSLMGAIAGEGIGVPTVTLDSSHKKQPSFDRNWTMGSASPSVSNTPIPTRPMSSSGLPVIAKDSPEPSINSTAPSSNLDALDRGYFSGGEAEGRQRNVLRKRSTTSHSRNSSYTDEQRLRSATAHSRHSRFGSVDSIRENPPSAAQKYYGLSVNSRRRTPSQNFINAPPRPLPPPKDPMSPTVTKLDNSALKATTSPTSPKSRGADWLLPVKPITGRHIGLRAISDAVTGNEKARITSPTEATSSGLKESPLPSPARTTTTGSSTPSAGPSFELDSPEAKTTSTMTTPGSAKAARKKSKKETSAYTRGLEKKTPQEQMVGADYSGWMKKKNTNLMTTWKPRLFILKGRRLSYYYSETDAQEKGLIDISGHRVLPADNDRLTGLHATLTGATNSPTSPSGAQSTMSSVDAAAEPVSTLSKSGGDSMFIFKLVPPRPGMSKAVSFTKPTIHYFAVPNVTLGRLWMAALMKATIDRDDTKPITTTYQQKTISLARAQQLRHRPPALMNLDEHVDEEALKTPASDKQGLNIQGIVYDEDSPEGDGEAQKLEGVNGMNGSSRSADSGPQTA